MAKKVIKKLNKKVSKKASNQIDFNSSIEAIKESSSQINDQIIDTVKVVADDIVSAGKQITGDVYKKAAQTINGIQVDDTIETFKSNIQQVNEFTMDTAEEIVDGALKNGEHAQEIAAKAMKEGLKLAAKQQEIIFDTLDAVKKQMTKSSVRLKEIFS